MATTFSPVAVDEPKIGGRGPTVVPPPRGWGDGRPDEHRDRLRRYRIGMFFALAAVVMLFVSFTSAYIVRQGVGTWSDASARYVTDWQPISLPPILWINTIILLASSFTLAMARRVLSRKLRAAPRGSGSPADAALIVDDQRSLPWLGITFVLGAGFLVGQLLAWEQMRHLGIFVSTNPSSSFFYVLTGAHGLHLLGGVLALAYAGLTSLLRKPLATRFLVVDVSALYWHFMDFLWIYIFALLHFAR